MTGVSWAHPIQLQHVLRCLAHSQERYWIFSAQQLLHPFPSASVPMTSSKRLVKSFWPIFFSLSKKKKKKYNTRKFRTKQEKDTIFYLNPDTYLNESRWQTLEYANKYSSVKTKFVGVHVTNVLFLLKQTEPKSADAFCNNMAHVPQSSQQTASIIRLVKTETTFCSQHHSNCFFLALEPNCTHVIQ